MILEMINSLRLTSFYYLLTKKHIIKKKYLSAVSDYK